MGFMGIYRSPSVDQTERLAILSEECAEVIVAVSKILRHGYGSCNPLAPTPPEDKNPETNRMLLERELGDVMHAIAMLHDTGDISKSEIYRYEKEKAIKIKKWLHHQ